MDSALLPMVTVIVPSTRDRKEFNQRIGKMIDAQDYPNFEFTFCLDDDMTLGAKRNLLCNESRGTIILHADSDDWYSQDWISRSVKALMENKADIVGLSNLHFYDFEKQEAFLYSYKAGMPNPPPWVAGATMCYWKTFWEANKFKDIPTLEDAFFLKGVTREPKVFAHNYIEGFIAAIHSGNTCKKNTELVEYNRLHHNEEAAIKERWANI